jgi:hypothetical protein
VIRIPLFSPGLEALALKLAKIMCIRKTQFSLGGMKYLGENMLRPESSFFLVDYGKLRYIRKGRIWFPLVFLMGQQ